MKKFMFAVAVVVMGASLHAADKLHTSVLQKISLLIRSSVLRNQNNHPIVCSHSLGGCNCGAAPIKNK